MSGYVISFIIGIASSMVAGIIMARYLHGYCSSSITNQVIINKVKDDSSVINQQDDSPYILIGMLIFIFIVLLIIFPTQVALYGWP